MSQPGYADRVRTYLKALSKGETVRTRDVRVDCDLSERQCLQVLKDMLDRGEIERIERGVYRCVNKNYNPNPSSVRDKIMRAIHTQGLFNYREIKVLSDANAEYIKETIKELVEAGDLEVLKRQKDETTGGYAKRFRVRWPDEFWRVRVLKKGGDDGKNK